MGDAARCNNSQLSLSNRNKCKSTAMSLTDDDKDRPVMLEISWHVKTNNKNGIIECLAQLKTKPKCCTEFVQNGGLYILIGLMRSRNLKILNLTLSILANVCLEPDVREEIKATKIGVNVVILVQNLRLDSILYCRACRLIGNLSESSWHARCMCDAGVIQALSLLLQSRKDVQIYLMVIRALRNIWKIYPNSREEILESEVIRMITELLILAEEKSADSAKYVDLAEACLKALPTFVSDLNSRSGKQMQGNKDRQGYRCLIRYCSKGNKMAVKCFYSLCQIADCRLLLGTCGAIEQIITIVNDSSDLCKELLISLCLFCLEAVNRARVRIGGGLELILALLKIPKYEKYHPMLLQALSQYIYDETGIAILIKHGILEILVATLSKMASAVANEEVNVSRKRSFYSPPRRKTAFKYGKGNRGRFSLDYHRDDWSPGSATSVSSSPSSTPPLYCYGSIDSGDNGDDNYSPICSDTERGENDEDSNEDMESLNSCKSLNIDTDNSRDCEKINKTSNACDHTTLLLLGKLSLSTVPVDRLADPTTIKPLFDYIRHGRSLRASKILSRIVRNVAYFMPLLKQGFVFEVLTLDDSEQYIRQLHTLAETGGAIGELSTVLLRGEEDFKYITAVSIPHLVTSRPILRSLLDNHGGLRLIFHLLNDPQQEMYEKAIRSIRQLAMTLQIHPEVLEKSSSSRSSREYQRISNERHPELSSTVTFELDDGTTIDTCRHTLCQRSDVFSAMLEGNFHESGKRRVRLRNTSKDALNTLILAAIGASFQHKPIESMLDAIVLADKFLMPEVSDILSECAISVLDHKNFSRAWAWANGNSCREFESCCVKSFLTADMSQSETLRAFRDFSHIDEFQEFLKQIKEIIVDALCQR